MASTTQTLIESEIADGTLVPVPPTDPRVTADPCGCITYAVASDKWSQLIGKDDLATVHGCGWTPSRLPDFS